MAKEVCGVLGLDTSNLSKVLDSDEKTTCPVHYTDQIRHVAVINESGLYSLIMRSRKPQAKAFRKWVTSEVLSSIRKDGGYIQATPEMTEAEIMAKAVLLAQKTIEKQASRIKKLEPKADAYDAFIGSEGVWNLRSTAKMLSVGPIKLTRTLRHRGVFMDDNKNTPYARYMDAGYLGSRFDR